MPSFSPADFSAQQQAVYNSRRHSPTHSNAAAAARPDRDLFRRLVCECVDDIKYDLRPGARA
ncbi:MAG: hypothetical protein ACXWC4_04355 [Telluria sp.]